MRKRRPPSRLFVLLAVLFLIAAGGYVIIYLRASLENRHLLEIEAAKSMLQIMAVAIIGNVALKLVRDHEERQKAWAARRDLLRKDLSEALAKCYARSKQVRRLLRAATDIQTGGIDYTRYAEFLREISDIQLDIERLVRAADAGARLAIVTADVRDHLRSMDHYLGNLVTEYESSKLGEGQSVIIEQQPRLRDFVAKQGPSDFRRIFVTSYREASVAIEKVIEADLSAPRGS